MRTRLALVVVAMLAAGTSCGSRDARPVEPPLGAIDLRDATELVAQLSSALRVPAVVDTEAVPLTRCARVTLLAPRGTARAELMGLARTVLRGAALSLDDGEGHLVIARIAELEPPAGCTSIPHARTLDALLDPIAGLAGLPGMPSPTPDPSAPVEGIRAIAENTWEFDPDAPIFADGMEGMMRAARVVPHEVDGRVDGMRLYGIRRSSVFGALGFQNGDTVTSLNGRALQDPETALEAYGELRTADRIVVELVRRDAPLTLTYLRRAVAPTP